MFSKTFLVNQIVNFLSEKEFEVTLTDGCFDIAARGESLILIKVFVNIDSISQDHASSLKAISYFVSAYPLVISMKTNRDFLANDTVYSRFLIPVMTPELFGKFLDEEKIPYIQSAKGQHTISINALLLRKKRKEMSLSLNDLAREIGISKKSLYEIENNRTNPRADTVKKLESFLGIYLQANLELKKFDSVEFLDARNNFQKKVSSELSRIGIENSSIFKAPFEIIGKENFSIITSLSQNSKKILHAEKVKRISSIFSSKAIYVSKKSEEDNVEGIPVILESELLEIESSKELAKIIEEKVSKT